MKLYFYFLEKDKKNIRVEECDVIETQKRYKPVTKFPDGFIGIFIEKRDIGIVPQHYYSKYCIVLDAPDIKLVKETFVHRCKETIECQKRAIEEIEDIIAHNEELIDIINNL